MPPHTADEFVFEASQQSSDDPSFEQAFINHMKAVQKRNNHKREVKFLQAAETKLTDEINTTTKAVRDCMQRLETLYQKFLLEHAASEDRIRALWSKIHVLSEKYHTTLEDMQKEQIVQEETIEEKQAAGLGKVRKACEAYIKIVGRLQQVEE